MDQLYTLSRVIEVAYEFAQPVHMCYVDLEKAFDCIPLKILWEVPLGYGGPLMQAIGSLYDQSQSLVRIVGSNFRSFAAECEATEMRISTSRSEATIFSWTFSS